KTGAGILSTPSTTNTFVGAIIQGGVWFLSTSGRNLGNTNSTLTFNGGTLQVLGGINLAFNLGVTIGAGGGIVDVTAPTGATFTMGGNFTGSGDFTKTGASTLSMTGDDSAFTGKFHLNQGQVTLSGSAGVAGQPPAGNLLNASIVI